MKDWKKILKRVVAGGIAASFICGLSIVYIKNDLKIYTKRRLEDEYGEKFKIKTVLNKKDAVAYPVNNPQLLFETHYNVKHKGGGFNCYLEEIVAQQFKELVEEKMADFKYKYYIDVDVYWTDKLGRVGTAVTIEDFDELTDSKPYYDIYLSSEALNYSDEELYQLIESIASIHSCYIEVCFVTDTYYDKIVEHYSIYPKLSSGDFYRKVEEKFGGIGNITLENGKLKKDLDEFIERMQEVRNNELYR